MTQFFLVKKYRNCILSLSMRFFFFFIITLFAVSLMIGCSPWSQNVQERCEEDISVDKNESVTFLLMSTEEEIIVPSKLQRILVEKLSDQTNLKRFPKSLLMPIGHFYINGKKWEWCGGRLFSFGSGYYYISELDPPKTSSLYKYTHKYISKENRNTPEYTKRLRKLKNEVEQYFSIYN